MQPTPLKLLMVEDNSMDAELTLMRLEDHKRFSV